MKTVTEGSSGPGPAHPRSAGRTGRVTAMRVAYFFLAAAAFAFVACWEVTSACFFLAAPSVIVCFCVAFFCVDFGDLSPMIVVLSLSLLAHGAGIAAGA